MAPKKRRASEITRHAKRQSTARRSAVEPREPPPALRHQSHGTVPAQVFVHGTGDCGQLGLGEDEMERKRPTPVDLSGRRALQVAAGGMHTVALADDGTVWSWGVNDEGALGRQTAGELWEKAPERKNGKDGDPYLPGRVAMPTEAKAVQLSAGDSHTMVLTDSGAVYGWGTFRDAGGVYGFAPGVRIQLTPRLLYQPASPDARISCIASGADHVVALTTSGKVLTWGTGQQGQLGRLPARTTGRGNAAEKLLTPSLVTFKRHRGVHTTHMADVAAGTYSSFAVTTDGRVEAWGLNNYGQLALPAAISAHHTPSVVAALLDHSITAVAGGQHHTLAVTKDGQLLSFGRPTYGGLGRAAVDTQSDDAQPTPQRVDGLDGVHVAAAAAGIGVSSAVGADGELWIWGFGETCQLGRPTEDDELAPKRVAATHKLAGHRVIQLEIGGQHVAMLAVEDPNAAAANGTSVQQPNGSAADEAADMDEDDAEDKAADGAEADDAAAAGGAQNAAAAADAPNPDDLWAAAVAASAPQSNTSAAAAPDTVAAVGEPAAAAAPSVAAGHAAAEEDAAAANWAAAVAASRAEPVAPPPPAAAEVVGDAPATMGTHGAEAAVPEQRADAPDSVADGPTPMPESAGFTGAAAPAVSDLPFIGTNNPAPRQ